MKILFFITLTVLFSFTACIHAEESANDNKVLSKEEFNKKLKSYDGKGLCQKDSDCQFIGVGSRPCGGPSYYAIYSNQDANVIELKQLVERFNKSQKAHQKKKQMVGICVVAKEPRLSCVDQRCQNRKK